MSEVNTKKIVIVNLYPALAMTDHLYGKNELICEQG